MPRDELLKLCEEARYIPHPESSDEEIRTQLIAIFG